MVIFSANRVYTANARNPDCMGSEFKRLDIAEKHCCQWSIINCFLVHSPIRRLNVLWLDEIETAQSATFGHRTVKKQPHFLNGAKHKRERTGTDRLLTDDPQRLCYMPWEMRLQKSLGSFDPNHFDTLLGAPRSVHSQIQKFFPDTEWVNLFIGKCGLGDGTIEFDIRGDPVEFVWLQIRSDLALVPLISLVRANAWALIDESSESPFESSSYLASLGDAPIPIMQNRSTKESCRNNPTATLPRIKSRVPLLMVQPTWILNELELVALHDDEATLDVFDEYSKEMWQQEHVRSQKGHPTAAPDEVHVSGGLRFGAFLLPRINEQVSAFFYDYLRRTSRDTAKYANGEIVMKDGTRIDGTKCEWIERVSGRALKR